MGKSISQLSSVTPAGTDLVELARLSATDIYTAATISAAASDNSLNSGAAAFPAWMVAGARINIAGFTGDTDNNYDSAVILAIPAPTASKVVLGASTPLVDDAAGESVTITAWESVRTTAQDIADLAAASGGPSVASRYTLDLASQTDGDPGSGKLRFNHATPASATKIFLDDETSDGVDLSTTLLDLGSSGYIRIQSVDDVGEWLYAKWTAITDDSGYFDIAISVLSSKGALDDTDDVLVTFDAKGSSTPGGSFVGIESTASFTRPSDTTTYGAGDVICNSTSAPTIMTFTGVGAANGGAFILQNAKVIDSAAQALKPDIDLFLFKSSVTIDNDNSGFTPTDVEMEDLICVVSFYGAAFVVGSGNGLIKGQIEPAVYECGAGTTSIYGVSVARNSYIPISAEEFDFVLGVLQL
jgi:hypothetical protein